MCKKLCHVLRGGGVAKGFGPLEFPPFFCPLPIINDQYLTKLPFGRDRLVIADDRRLTSVV